MRAAPRYVVASAEIDWRTNTTPASKTHGDIYWSLDRGLAEKQHVFIEGNSLESRFARLDRGHFTLCEVGFGFGLNFLLTAQAWRKAAPRNSILNYIAIERAPVTSQDLQRVLAALGNPFGKHQTQLVARYPLASPGNHTVWVDTDICLILIIEDVGAALEQTDARVDAWYLDGFSPSANPDAWQDALFLAMAEMSRPGASVSTYSVAGRVRRGLGEAGFTTSRQPGFGSKAEMLTAALGGEWSPATITGGTVGIIGAGIAGLHCAVALRRRGVETMLFDAAGTALSGASSIPRLAIYPGLAVRPDAGSLFSIAAFEYAMSLDGVSAPGRLQVAKGEADATRLRRIAEWFPETFAAFVQDPDYGGALWLPTAGYCSRHTMNEETVVNATVAKVSTGQIALASGELYEVDNIILAPGSAQMDQLTPLEFVPARGQSLRVHFASPRADMRVIGGDVAMIPIDSHRSIVGSTYRQYSRDMNPDSNDTESLLAKLGHVRNGTTRVEESFVGVRCTTRDRTPVVGALPDWDALTTFCGGDEMSFASYCEGIYVCTGFGSHGATHAPFCAEHVARMITGEAGCLSIDWTTRLNAARFALRDAKKRGAIRHARLR